MKNFLAITILGTVLSGSLALANEMAFDDYYRGLEAHDTGKYAEAVIWYYKAVKQGVAIAQFKLGSMYVAGQAVSRNYISAHMWLNMAGLQGIEIAKTKMNILEKRMTASELEEARRRAKICLNSNYKNCD
jgi:TPR repeat protein